MRKILTALLCSIVFVAGINYQAIADYAATAGSGLTFGSVDLAGIKFPAFLVCDFTTAKQCGAVKAGNTAVVADIAQVVSDPNVLAAVQAAIPDCGATPCTNKIGNVYLQSQYPAGATAITASATGTTGATTATLAGTSAKTTFICGYSIRANATAAATVTNTVTGVITATMSHIMWVAPLASGIGVDEQIFSPCIPASATNTGIAIVSGAPGSGGTVSSTGWGYQL